VRSAEEIWIVGCGAVTALGHSAAMTAASVRANLSRFRESYMVDKAGEPMRLSMARFISDSTRGVERFLALANPAVTEAIQPLSDAGADRLPIRIRLCLGFPLPRPGLAPDVAERVQTRLGNIRFDKSGRTFESGHASGLLAIHQAADWLRSDQADFVLTGGIDSYYDADTLEWLDAVSRLHSEANMDGFVPGEGAGFCLLASSSSARKYGLKPLATILSTAVEQEPHPFTSDGVCIGQGLTSALGKALLANPPAGKSADWTICDMNGESFRSAEWIYAYLRTGPKHRDPLELWHPADCYGDIGAASGPVLASIAIRAWMRGYARGSRSLVWNSSDEKDRAAVLLERASLN
jgi:3-oxoacyl-[acyl-carrier-protein] synthase I